MPAERHTIWNLIFGSSMQWLSVFGSNQVQVQRYLSASSIRSAKLALNMNLIAYSSLTILNAVLGMIIFAYYNGCNILKDKPAEQLLPLFIMDSMKLIPGIPGLFLSVLFAAVLSSISSGINGLSATIIEDFLKNRVTITDKNLAKISRILCVIFGLLIMSLTYIPYLINNSLQTVLSLFR